MNDLNVNVVQQQPKRLKFSCDLEWKDLIENPGLSAVSVQIFSYLDYKSLLICRTVAKSWKHLIDSRLKKSWVNDLKGMKETRWNFFHRWPEWMLAFSRILHRKKTEEVLIFWTTMSEYFKVFPDGEEDEYPQSPLHFTAKNGALDQLKLLMAQTQNYEVVDNARRTAFIWACWKGRDKVVEYLFKHRELMININARDNGGMTGLMWASLKGHTKVVQLLIKEPIVDVNIVSIERRTAFMWACFFHREEVVDVILKAAETREINLNVTDRELNSGWDYWPEKFDTFNQSILN